MKKNLRYILSVLVCVLALVSLPQETEAASWKKNSIGWWYENDNGSWTASSWKQINGRWYYFDQNGYMTTGWRKINGKWYYMNSSGAMTTGWQKTGAYWYYMYTDGSMASGTWIGTYYVDGDGRWVPDYQPARWKHNARGWWYQRWNGSYPAGAWEKIKNIWYYFDRSGYMTTGWQKVNGTWYYLHASGAMAHDAWVGNYYLTSSGAMAVSQWIGQYYVGADGKWIPNYKHEVDSIKVYGTNKMTLGGLQKLAVIFSPAEAVVTAKTFTSSDETIAVVDGTGVVTALKEGLVTITVQYDKAVQTFVIEVEKEEPVSGEQTEE